MSPLDKNLPALEGTPKQVAWAEDIRNSWIKNILEPEQQNYKELSEEIKAEKGEEKRFAKGLAAMSKDKIVAGKEILKTTSAKTIIDLHTRNNFRGTLDAVSDAIDEKKSTSEIKDLIEKRSKW